MKLKRNLVWIVLFAGIILSTSCNKQPSLQQKFEPLYRSEKSVEGAIMSGVSYERYNELVSGFATELLIAREKTASTEEVELLQVYFEVLTTYQDGLTLWKRQIDSVDYEWTGDKIIQDETVAPLVKKYQLETTQKTKGTYKWIAIAPDSIQKIWAAAGIHAEKASQYYLKDGKN